MSVTFEGENVPEVFLKLPENDDLKANGVNSKKKQASSLRLRRLTTRLKSRFMTRRKSVAKTYADSFTINGLTKIATGERWERILWLVVLTIALSLVAYVVSGFVVAYNEHEVRTDIRVVEGEKLIYPDVMICNDRYFRNDPIFCHNGKSIKDDLRLDCQAKLSADVHVSAFEEKVKVFTGRVSDSIKYLGQCKRVNLSGIYTPRLRISVIPHDKTDANIRPNMLHVFFIDRNSTDEFHLEGTQIFHNLKRGNYNFQIYERKIYKRLPAPYPSNCTNGVGTDLVFPGEYTQAKCVESFIFKLMLEECGTVVDTWKPYLNVLNGTYRSRNLPISEVHRCLSTKQEIIYRWRLYNISCPIPCFEEAYKVGNIFLEEYEAWYFDIAYNTQRTTLVKEIPVYTMESLLSEIGGFLGLFVGMSILSLIEIVVYIFVSTKEKYYGI